MHSKYGYLGSRGIHHVRVNSQASTKSNSKILNTQAVYCSNQPKVNVSRSEKSKDKQPQNSIKRKKSKSRGEIRPKSVDKLKQQILDYLQVYIMQGEEEHNISRETYQQRLTILNEFLCYLEEKNIINPDTLSNVEEVKKLVTGLIKIDLTKICNLTTPKENNSSKNYKTNIPVSTYKNPNISKPREKFSFKDKENEPVEIGHHRRQQSTRIESNWVLNKNKLHEHTSRHRHNQSWVDPSLKLREIDCNQIINQKNVEKTGDTQSRYSLRPSSVNNNYVIDKNNKVSKVNTKESENPVINVSKKVSKIQMIPTPVYNLKEEKREREWLDDSSSTTTLGMYSNIKYAAYNKSVSSERSTKENVKHHKRISGEYRVPSDNPSQHKWKHINRIEEVDESNSEFENTDTIQVSAVANYDPDSAQSMARHRRNLRLWDRINEHIWADENMKTKKNYEGAYSRQQKHKLHDSLEVDNISQSSNESSTNKKVRYEPEYDLLKAKDSKSTSRHRRINVESNNPTIIRNMSKPEFIADYDITERVPIQIIESKKPSKEGPESYHKYSDKYCLIKNSK